MSIAGFDKLRTNYQLLMSLPFREGVGTITRDGAKPHHQDVRLVGFPDWVRLASGLGVLEFNGVADYLECSAADCADLDFTSEDYSLTCWLCKEPSVTTNMLMGRYGVNLDGWEVYLLDAGAPGYLELRHHHQSLAPDSRDGCYSDGWPLSTWCFMAITRSGLYPRHYRNGMEVEVVYESGGLKDPDSCNRDLVIGTRYTKDTNWFPGRIWNPRAWLGALAPSQVLTLYRMDSHWFDLW